MSISNKMKSVYLIGFIFALSLTFPAVFISSMLFEEFITSGDGLFWFIAKIVMYLFVLAIIAGVLRKNTTTLYSGFLVSAFLPTVLTFSGIGQGTLFILVFFLFNTATLLSLCLHIHELSDKEELNDYVNPYAGMILIVMFLSYCLLITFSLSIETRSGYVTFVNAMQFIIAGSNLIAMITSVWFILKLESLNKSIDQSGEPVSV